MDREKVIKESEEAIEILAKAEESTFWMDFVRCAFENALAMLKEQEAVQPTWGRGKPFCGACGLRIHGGKFCSECGKPILWEGR